MTLLSKHDLKCGRRQARRGRFGRIVRGTLYVKLGLAFTLLVVALACFLRLAAGPVSLQDYAGRVGEALAGRIGPGWTVTLEDTALELHGILPAVRTKGLEIRNPAGASVVKAPFAVVSLDPISLLTGTVSPREIEFRDLDLRGRIAEDGTLSIVPQGDGRAAAVPEAAPSQAVPGRGPEPSGSGLSAALASLLDPLVAGTGLIGALDRATVVGARLILVGQDGRERAAFSKVGAVFQRVEGGDRRIDLDLDGARGAWHVRGVVHGGPDRRAELVAENVPLTDILLLTGLSNLPANSDLTLGARLSVAYDGRRLTRLEGQLDSSAGAIKRAGHPPLVLDRASAEASWDEEQRRLRIVDLEVASEGTRFRLSGDLADGGRDGWRLKLSGRDAVVAGLTARDPAFRLGSVAADVRFADGGITVEQASIKGEALDIELSGTLVPGQDGPVVRGLVEARATNARRLVRLWPDALNPDLRAYLSARLGAGTVDRLRLRSVLDGRDLRAVTSDAPMSDGSLDLRFAVSGAELSVVDGLPPLRGLSLEGKVSGTKASLVARDGFVEMADGRRLSFSDASFVHTNFGRADKPAQIGFRVSGGMDALASLMRLPLIRDTGAPDIDPATLHGQVDLRVTLPFVPGPVPPLKDLALAVTGTLSDIGVDRLPGRERLDGGQFTVGREAGSLSIRGEARLTGSPATFDLQVPRLGVGELTVSTVLDDAGRARRSLPGAPALSGPVPLKIVIPLGGRQDARGEARVEADLGRVAIDGLIPGWVKPANRPGRLSFTLGAGESPELRDLAVDAGSVQIKGQVNLSAAGGLERADFPVFRLSPGDDIRAQVERLQGGPYRVVLKGGNADARPVLKWMTAIPVRAGAAREGGAARESQDVELDLAVSILSGFNDEALTGVSGKLATKDGELRSLQFGGRFRGAQVEAQLGKRDSGAPILSVRSGDAGATLRFLDLYRRMVGGRLSVDARSGEGVQEGRVTVEEFGLRNEPALRSIVSQAAPQQPGVSDERGQVAIVRPDADQVLFNRLHADFRRSGSRVDYTDAVIYGTQVGFNLSGYVDHARDRLDITGTFVPAYLLNNAFSQLPVVGLLLGGGRTEGLFAVEFRVAGALSSPTLTVNPLTAVAPGILRKLFGWMLQDGPEPADGPAAQAPPRRSAR